LCGVELEPVVHALAKQLHPQVDDCEVEYTDEWGISIELPEVVEQPSLITEAVNSGVEDGILLQRFPPADEVIADFFREHGLEKLGGQSSGRGWSSFALYQRCPYAWKRRYIDQVRSPLWIESPSLAIGSLVHALLALYYGNMTESAYAHLTPEMLFEYARSRANTEFVNEAWRLFTAYELYYRHEQIIPLAIEHDVHDPRTHESCRYDLVAFFPEDLPGRRSGTYIVESKTAARFDYETLNGWQNDGECLGEVALWKRLGLDKRFGELRGLMVNIIGKQKEPKMHRTVIAPSTWQIDQHLKDLKRWEGLMNLARSTEVFPRARGGCINRYGMCGEWDHCLNNEEI
jgi:hypothetical protein